MPAVNKVPVERVRQLLSQGMKARQVCERLGINKSSVYAVVKAMKEAKA